MKKKKKKQLNIMRASSVKKESYHGMPKFK